jgi:hypothetical protein
VRVSAERGGLCLAAQTMRAREPVPSGSGMCGKFALYRCRGNRVARAGADMINGELPAKCARKYALRAISCGTHRFRRTMINPPGVATESHVWLPHWCNVPARAAGEK